ncbi:5-hydroxytryptamine receptor 3A-like [Fundulus heteroclitus]|uniref:5-hydroxytryptamine receptor 3A-like n=1 Tax=Fundulus heteroclitus TaxID=8078 RepID=UPI00165B6730|nr:5-hydroxytryptamine receptor 3A-like [Fundulus heteroclitus]
MIFTLTCFMFLHTVGNPASCVSPNVHDDQLMSNQSLRGMSVGNATNYECSNCSNQTSNQTSDNKASICSYENIIDHLGLTKYKDRFTMSRPVKDHKNKTVIYLEMEVYAILDVKETDQTFIAYVWIYMDWGNDYAKWNKEDFCGISAIIVPSEALWKPDLTIEEMIEKDKSPPSPFLKIYHNGTIEFRNDQIVISTCKMHVYKFPFDIQSCNISFKSYLYGENELDITFQENSTEITKWSRDVMATEYEWVFVNMSVFNTTVNHFEFPQTVVIYTIFMRRKSVLHFASFVMPVLFFLCLDFFSLLMPHNGGEKVGFKTTVLLAITVMQLILIEILPFTSSKIPLIVIYCNGIFGLMLLSLLETIVVNYLAEKDSASQDELKEGFHCASRFPEVANKSPFTDQEGTNNQLTKIFLAVEKVSDELQEMKKSVTFLKEPKPGYWTELAKRIDKFFSVLYVTAVLVFLSVLFAKWLT